MVSKSSSYKKKKLPKTSRKVASPYFKKSEWGWPKDGTFWPIDARRRYIKNIFETRGFIARRETLAKKMGVSRRQLYDDIKWIYSQGLPDDYVEKMKVRHSEIHDLVEREMLNALKDSIDPKDRAAVAKVLLKNAESRTEFAESFGVKEREPVPLQTEFILSWGKKKKKDESE